MTKEISVGKVVQLLESWVPKKLAADWDNVGLQIGSLSHPVKQILVTLDVTEEVVDEAIEIGANLIISHHPLLFKSLKQINYQDPLGKLIQKIIKHDLTVYAAHTNLDVVIGGVNDLLASKLKLENTKILVPEIEEPFYKLFVYVPETHLDVVDQAITKIGVGQLGDYKDCSFRLKGTGTFTPLDNANPYIGSENKRSFVDEIKLEYLLPSHLRNQAIDAIKKAHPYEEPVFDIIKLENDGIIYGLGRIGTLKTEKTLRQLSAELKEIFQLEGLRVTGSLDRIVKKVAVLGGSGEKYYHHAKRLGADVYITGDVSFHFAQDALAQGLSIIDPGHHIEVIMVEAVSEYLREQLDSAIKVNESKISTEPFQFI